MNQTVRTALRVSEIRHACVRRILGVDRIMHNGIDPLIWTHIAERHKVPSVS